MCTCSQTKQCFMWILSAFLASIDDVIDITILNKMSRPFYDSVIIEYLPKKSLPQTLGKFNDKRIGSNLQIQIKLKYMIPTI